MKKIPLKMQEHTYINKEEEENKHKLPIKNLSSSVA